MATPRVYTPTDILNAQIGQWVAYTTLVIAGFAVLIRFPTLLSRLPRAILPISFNHPQPDQKIPTKTNPTLQILKHQFYRKPGWIRIRSIGILSSQLLPMLIYMGFLIGLAVYKNMDKRMSLMNANRHGFISLAHLPVIFILGMKNTPFGALIGTGYDGLNLLHRFMGRMMFVFAVVHGSLQIRYQVVIMNHFQLQNASLTGFVALCSLLVISVSSLRVLRKVIYEIFLITHILGYLTVLVTLWFHTPASHPYVTVAIGALIIDHLFKLIKTRIKRATFTAMPGGLTKIEVKGIKNGWNPGQHVFLRVLKGRHIFEKHPFTIANAPLSGSQDLILVSKATGDFTKSIYRLAGQSRISNEDLNEKKGVGSDQSTPPPPPLQVLSSDTSYRVILEGPYGISWTDLSVYETVLLCAGGSGFTYCMAMLEDLVYRKVKGFPIMTKQICLVWALRDLEMIESFANGLEETIRIGQENDLDFNVKIFNTSQIDIDPNLNPLPNTLIEFHHKRRPDLRSILQTILIEAPTRIHNPSSGGLGLGLGVCGPEKMVMEVEKIVQSLTVEEVQKIGGLGLELQRFSW